MILRLCILGTFLVCVACGRSVEPTYKDWLKNSGERINVNSFPAVSSETPRVVAANVLKQVRWALGEATRSTNSITRKHEVSRGTANQGEIVPFANGVNGLLQLPIDGGDASRKVPVVIWLNPFGAEDAPGPALSRSGFAVFTFDQIGSGSRKAEVEGFYSREPHWSLLGKMVEDTRAAIEAIAALPSVDTNRLWLLGFDQGSTLALHVAALDSRVHGVVAVGGFAPMRPSLANRGEPTFARMQRIHPVLPRFSVFVGHEDRIPYDHRELVDVIAPRPVLLFVGGDETGLDAMDLSRAYTPMKHVGYRVLKHAGAFEADAQRVVIDELKRAAAPRVP